MNTTDTIAAVSTPTGTGGIGVIRISGPEAFDVCGRIFSRDVKAMAGGTCAFGKITADDGSVIDEVDFNHVHVTVEVKIVILVPYIGHTA